MATYNQRTDITVVDFPAGSTITYVVPANSTFKINLFTIRAGFGDSGGVIASNGVTAIAFAAGNQVGPLDSGPLPSGVTTATFTVPAGWTISCTNGSLSGTLTTYSN